MVAAIHQVVAAIHLAGAGARARETRVRGSREVRTGLRKSQPAQRSEQERLPVDEHRACAKHRPARNRLGRTWLSRVASGCAILTSRQGCADPDNRQECADPDNRQECADPDNRQECADPDNRQGGNERGRSARRTPEPQAPHERAKRARRSAACSAGAERFGGFQAVLAVFVLCSERFGGFQAVLAVFVLCSERSRDFQAVSVAEPSEFDRRHATSSRSSITSKSEVFLLSNPKY